MNYKTLLRTILTTGTKGQYRNGVRHSCYGVNLMFDLQERFPLIGLKETKYHDAFVDLLWMIRGSNVVSELDDLGIQYNFWKPWEGADGTIGNLYGKAWREAPNNGYCAYPNAVLQSGDLCPSDKVFDDEWVNQQRLTVDQLANVIYGLRHHPNSSRHRIATYIPAWASYEGETAENNRYKQKGVITPCASFLQFTVANKSVNLHVTQASSDVLIGLPVNIAQYAALLTLVAREVNLIPGKLFYTINDAHIYHNQLQSVHNSGLLDRSEPMDNCQLTITGTNDIYHIDVKDLVITGYTPNPFVKIPVSP